MSFLHREWKSMLGCDGLEEDLAAGRVWLFADGLNEMPRKRYQEGMDDWRSFLSRYITPHGNRAFVACRVADYGEGIGAPRLIVHKMDPTRIWNFLQKGFPDRAADLWRDLVIDRDQRSGKIYELAQIPFWLMTLARLSKRTGLPGNRASLLEASVDQWLEYERTRDGGHPLSDDQCRAFIEDLINLAWAGLSRSQNYTFPLPEAKRILRAGNSAVDAGELLRLAQDCDFLAVEGENVRFHHQILQEYFAARELARRFAKGKNLRRHWRIPWEDWKFVYSRWDELPDPPQTNWEEALVLAAGMLDEQKAEALALAVLRDNSPLAARCAIESGAGVREQVQQKIKAGLQNDLQGRRQRLPARLAAGKMLARMGDPRLLRRQHAFQREDGKTVHFIEPEWVDIPAGSFTMGSTALERLLLWALHGVQPAPDERPAHTVSTGAYKVARYPVTVVEYFLFMDAGGYDNDAYWQAPGALRWRDAPPPFEESWMAYSIQALRADEKGTLEDLNVQVKQGRYSPAQAEAVCQALGMKEEALKALWWRSEAEKRNAQGRAVRPWRWDISDGSLHNRPVVGVTWFEACAYAAWLEESLRAQQLLPGQWRLRLPTEAEWEKAARGGRQGLWAWGSRWSRDRANTLEGRVMEPTPVGAYPSGASRYGAQDMHGNVWEWCWDWYAPGAYQNRAGKEVRDPQGPEEGRERVLRGGSWGDSRSLARCAYRGRDGPDNFLNYLGFRIVCSPSSTSDL